MITYVSVVLMRIDPLSRTLEDKMFTSMLVAVVISFILVVIGAAENRNEGHLSRQLFSSFLAIITLIFSIGLNIVKAIEQLAK
ncbi:MAG: hypothetical protein V1686_01015 [Patescibacteria group bacterium]